MDDEPTARRDSAGVALPVALRPETPLFAAIMGVMAVALAPSVTVRRMRRMDLSGTLRLTE